MLRILGTEKIGAADEIGDFNNTCLIVNSFFTLRYILLYIKWTIHNNTGVLNKEGTILKMTELEGFTIPGFCWELSNQNLSLKQSPQSVQVRTVMSSPIHKIPCLAKA